MSEQDGTQETIWQRPINNERWAWGNYWKQQGQPWRWEPEIDAVRQKYLDERYKVRPFGQVDFPFKGIKLSRADVEWLISTQVINIGLDLYCADLRGISLQQLPLEGVIFQEAHLEKANLSKTHLEKAIFDGAYLHEATLVEAHLEGAVLREAHLEGADLSKAHLEGANLKEAHLERAYLSETHFEGANLSEAFFDIETQLINIALGNKKYGFASFRDVRWGQTNLAVVDWSSIRKLGDESEAHRLKKYNGKMDDKREPLRAYRRAVRANRQLTVVLRDQGLNEEADHFAYRAQLLQRTVWRLQRRPLKLLLSWFLFLLAGYGYRPLRSLIAYLVIIFGFMGLYLLNAHFVPPHLSWDEALVLSISSFHGRGFFTQNVTLGDTYARLASVEAIVGLFIEISFIATFTKRFFGS